MIKGFAGIVIYNAIFGMLCFIPAHAMSQKGCSIVPGFISLEADTCVIVLPDPEGKLSSASVFDSLIAGKFLSYAEVSNLKPGWEKKRAWLSFSVENKGADSIGLIFTFSDLKEVWIVKEGLQKIPFVGHEASLDDGHGLLTLPERMFFTFRLPPKSVSSFLYRAEYPFSKKKLSPTIYEIRSFERTKNQKLKYVTLFNGMVLGIGLIIVVMSLVFYTQVRDASLLAYSLYVFFFLIYFWRDFEYMNLQFFWTLAYVPWVYTKTLLAAVVGISYTYFIRTLLRIPDRFPLVEKGLRISTRLILACLILDLVIVRISYTWSYWISPYFAGALLFCTLIFVNFHFIKSRDKVALFIALGSFLLAIGGLSISIFPVQIHGWIVRGTFILELCCFTAAIGLRSREVLDQKQKAEQDLEEKETRHQWELETKVAVEKAIEAERVRNRIAQDIHDEVGATLTKISLSAQLAARLKDLTLPDLKARFHQIGLNAREASAQLRGIIFAINPDFDQFSNIQAYFREIADQFWSETDVKVKFDFPKAPWDPVVSSLIKQQLLFIFKEAQNNIAKHASAKNVHIGFGLTSADQFYLQIRDDGQGFSIDEKRLHSNGLSGMKKRANRIGASISCSSRPGGGTFIQIEGRLLQE